MYRYTTCSCRSVHAVPLPSVHTTKIQPPYRQETIRNTAPTGPPRVGKYIHPQLFWCGSIWMGRKGRAQYQNRSVGIDGGWLGRRGMPPSTHIVRTSPIAYHHRPSVKTKCVNPLPFSKIDGWVSFWYAQTGSVRREDEENFRSGNGSTALDYLHWLSRADPVLVFLSFLFLFFFFLGRVPPASLPDLIIICWFWRDRERKLVSDKAKCAS
jgi:hypothetical protein